MFQSRRDQTAPGHFGWRDARARGGRQRRARHPQRTGEGTEVELRVPGAIAYGNGAQASWWSRIAGLFMAS